MSPTCAPFSGGRLPSMIAVLLAVLSGMARPGSPSSLTWWAKKVTPDVYTAGCLTPRQIQAAADDGFRSVLSMFNQNDNIDQRYPTSAQAEGVAKDIGLSYRVILDEGEYDWMRLETVQRFSEAFHSVPKPILFYCMTSYSATFTTLLHYVNVSRYDVTATPKMDAQTLLAQAATMGFDYVTDEVPMKMLQDISGAQLPALVRPNLTIPYWNFGFWPLKPVTQEWYASGRIKKDDLKDVKDLGFDALVSVIDVGEGTQSDTVTHGDGGQQTTVQSETGADRRMEKCTSIELADDTYSEDEAASTARDVGLAYYSVSMDSADFNVETWRQSRRKLAEVGRRHSAVLVHSRSGQRAVVMAILAAGCQYGYDSHWAVDIALCHGFPLSEISQENPSVIKTLTDQVRSVVERHDWLARTLYNLGITWEHQHNSMQTLFESILNNRQTECL